MVFDGELLGRIFTVPAAAWAATLAFIAHLVRSSNERKRDINVEKAGDWERIRSERDVAREERDLVRDKLAASEADKVMWMGRAVQAEAIIQGMGEARQRIALEEAAKRIVSDKQINGDGNDA